MANLVSFHIILPQLQDPIDEVKWGLTVLRVCADNNLVEKRNCMESCFLKKTILLLEVVFLNVKYRQKIVGDKKYDSLYAHMF